MSEENFDVVEAFRESMRVLADFITKIHAIEAEAIENPLPPGCRRLEDLKIGDKIELPSFR